MTAYGISRQLVRQPEHHDLRVHVAKLKEMNRPGRRQSRKMPAE